MIFITKYIFRIALERAFTQNQKPTSEEVYYISESLNMEKVSLAKNSIKSTHIYIYFRLAEPPHLGASRTPWNPQL